ncbi:hypothetical protein [Kocuria sp. TGY1127_2]|uniref:hypothetical protein n=1 Tax=Kocuria sp. TGY1127_2 TaxID=2711328 RepID=UPI0015BA78F8|nr:hypothetical protein [Kocuria sp. TGY1127_2]
MMIVVMVDPGGDCPVSRSGSSEEASTSAPHDLQKLGPELGGGTALPGAGADINKRSPLAELFHLDAAVAGSTAAAPRAKRLAEVQTVAARSRSASI